MGKRKERHGDESSNKALNKDKKKKKKRKTSSHGIKKEEAEEPIAPLEQQGQLDAQNDAIPENKNLSSSSDSRRPRSHSAGSISLTYADFVASTAVTTAVATQQQRHDSSTSVAAATHSGTAATTTTYFQKRVRLTVSLLPYSLHNPIAAIRASLRKRLLRYDRGWGGILLAFDNVDFRKENNNNNSYSSSKAKGWILNEMPYIHYHVDCDILVFAPTVGCQLQGRVSECFPSHVSMLVFGYINAMMSADTLHKAGLRFDHDSQTWMAIHTNEIEAETDIIDNDNNNHYPYLQTISKNMKLKFVVSKIYECDSTISLEGKSPVSSLLVES